MKLARIPVDRASEIIPILISEGIADPGAKICKTDTERFVPIHEEREKEVIGMGFAITDGEAFRRGTRSPQYRIKEHLAHLPADVIDELPMRWEFVGDIVILKMNKNAFPYKKEIGEAYATELCVKAVCADIDGISGEFRRPGTELIHGSSAESVRLENGIRYKFDVTKIMFASGNTDERNRMKNLDCSSETIVDMFAGIGYFTLPIAKFTGAGKVIACEKNPDSYHYLCENTVINGVTGTVTPVLGDNRNLEVKNADRIIMGYVQRTSEFLDKAKEMIRPGGTIHYHDTFYVNEYRDRIMSLFTNAFGQDGYSVTMIKEVKSFAPAVSHYVADVVIL